MDLVMAICPQCGKELEVDRSQEAAVCTYCKTPFVVDKAINGFANGTVHNPNGNYYNHSGIDINALFKRIDMFFEDKDYQNVLIYADKILDVDPENADAYVSKLLAEAKVDTLKELKNSKVELECYPSYKYALRFVDDSTKEYIESINQLIKRNKKEIEIKKKQNKKNNQKKGIMIAVAAIPVIIMLVIYCIYTGYFTRKHFNSVEAMQEELGGHWYFMNDFMYCELYIDNSEVMSSCLFTDTMEQKPGVKTNDVKWHPHTGKIELGNDIRSDGDKLTDIEVLKDGSLTGVRGEMPWHRNK